MEHTLEHNRIVYNLKRSLMKMIEDCSTTECRSVLSSANERVLWSLNLLGFEDKSSLDLYFNKEDK
jgi:hypothetical protein